MGKSVKSLYSYYDDQDQDVEERLQDIERRLENASRRYHDRLTDKQVPTLFISILILAVTFYNFNGVHLHVDHYENQ